MDHSHNSRILDIPDLFYKHDTFDIFPIVDILDIPDIQDLPEIPDRLNIPVITLYLKYFVKKTLVRCGG